MLSGTVRFFNAEKGFGFIQADSGGAEVFVHVSAVELSGLGSLSPGERILYKAAVDRQGRYAASVLKRAEAGHAFPEWKARSSSN
jgi:CspA family cold shock protein